MDLENVDESQNDGDSLENSEDTNVDVEQKKSTLVGGDPDAKQEDDQNSDEIKQDDESGDEEEKREQEESDGAPEEYSDFQFSDGFEADPELMGKFTELAKSDNLSQDKAQKYTEMGEEVAKKAYHDAYEKQVNAWSEKQEKWVEEIKNDPEVGGKDFDKNLSGCNAVLAQFGDKEFRDELESSGFGNNAGLVRMLHRINKATQSDVFIKGGAMKKEKTPEEKWYKNSRKQ